MLSGVGDCSLLNWFLSTNSFTLFVSELIYLLSNYMIKMAYEMGERCSAGLSS